MHVSDITLLLFLNGHPPTLVIFHRLTQITGQQLLILIQAYHLQNLK